MSQLPPVCLSLAPNLRWVGFSPIQFGALLIPPGVELILSLFFIHLYSGPGRARILLAADGILYFIWALLDMLSHVVPAARISLSIFKRLDFFVGAVSFIPILLYSLYLYHLSFHDFIPTLPRKLQPYPEYSLPILLVIAVAINEVASFVGTNVVSLSPNQPLVISFSHNSESLWLSLSRFSLSLYTIIQILFFLLSFTRLTKAFLDQRRIEVAQSDEHHFFNGITWITLGICVGAIETIAGFAYGSFAVALARRILRLVARAILMFGLLKGLDVAENFENLTDELRGVSRISRRISRMLGVNPQRMSMFRPLSQSFPYQHREASAAEMQQLRDQRVTVHYEKGQAPFLQIRFSTLDFPDQAALADMFQHRPKSVSGFMPGYASAGGSVHQHGDDVSAEMAAARNAVLGAPRAKSVMVLSRNGNRAAPEWITPPERAYARPESGATISDSMSVVRDLERRFPNIPPRVTGKYRGSVLGQGYEEDPYPVVGISREPSMRRDAGGPPSASEEGGASVALSSSSSIKRKPAPPLLEHISYASRDNRRASTWGGLTQNTVNYPTESPVIPDSPWAGTTAYSSPPPTAGEPSSPKSRTAAARDMFRRASKAISDASIRSAEWLATASSPPAARTPLTAADIEMYRRGSIGPGSARRMSDVGANSVASGENLLPKKGRRSIDDAMATSKPSKPTRPQIITRVSIGRVPMRTTPTPTRAEQVRRERVFSLHGSVNMLDEIGEANRSRRATMTQMEREIGPQQSFFLSD